MLQTSTVSRRRIPPCTALPRLFGITYDDRTSTGSRDGLGRVRHESESDDPDDTAALTINDYQYDEQGRLWKYSQKRRAAKRISLRHPRQPHLG